MAVVTRCPARRVCVEPAPSEGNDRPADRRDGRCEDPQEPELGIREERASEIPELREERNVQLVVRDEIAGQEREEGEGSDNHGDGLRELAPSRHRPGRGTIASGPRGPPRGRPFCVGILLRVDERPELVEKLRITPIGRSAKLPSGWVDAAGQPPRGLVFRRIQTSPSARTSPQNDWRPGRPLYHALAPQKHPGVSVTPVVLTLDPHT